MEHRRASYLPMRTRSSARAIRLVDLADPEPCRETTGSLFIPTHAPSLTSRNRCSTFGRVPAIAIGSPVMTRGDLSPSKADRPRYASRAHRVAPLYDHGPTPSSPPQHGAAQRPPIVTGRGRWVCSRITAYTRVGGGPFDERTIGWKNPRSGTRIRDGPAKALCGWFDAVSCDRRPKSRGFRAALTKLMS